MLGFKSKISFCMQAAIVLVAFVVVVVVEGQRLVLVHVLGLEEGAQVDLSVPDAPLAFRRDLD